MTDAEMKRRIVYALSIDGDPDRPGIGEKLKLFFHDCSAAEKTAVLRLAVEDWLTDHTAHIHKGLLAYVFDTAITMSIAPFLTNGYFVTLTMTVRHIAPVPVGSHILFKTTLIHAGRSTYAVRCEATVEESGILAAAAESTYMRVPDRTEKASAKITE